MAMEPLHHPPPRRRRQRRRWLRGLLITLAVLLALVLIAVQLVLWSPLPRRIAESQIRKELGAEAHIGSVSVGWLGETVVENLTLTLPMGSDPVVRIRRIDIRHAALPAMAVAPAIRSVVIDGLVLDVRQDRLGEWNVQQLFDRPPDPDKTPPPAVLNIPDIKAADVTVKITRNDGAHAELTQVRLEGSRQPPLVYAVTAAVGPELKAEGKMALTRDLSHKLELTMTQVPQQLKPILGDLPDPLRARFTWLGRRTSHGLEGTLRLTEAAVKQVRVAGELELFTRDRRLIAEPRGLTVSTVASPAATRPSHVVTLEGGQISMAERLELRQVRAHVAGGRLAIEGSIHPRTFAGDLTIGWENLAGASGSAAVKVIRELTGGIIAAADIKGSFDLAGGRATGAMRISGGGDSLKNAYALIETDAVDVAYPDGRQFAIPGIEMTLRSDGREIAVSSLRPRDPQVGQVAAVGSYDWTSQTWKGWLQARDLWLHNIRVPGVQRPIDLNLNAYGTLTRYNVKEAYLRHGSAAYWVEGFYDSRMPDPVHLDAWAWYQPPRDPDSDAEFEVLQAQAEITGTLSPRRLAAKGSLHANDLHVRGRRVGDISALVEARVEDDVARIVSRDDIELLGGKWAIDGRWRDWGRGRQPFVLKIDWRGLPVERLAELGKLTGFGGMVTQGTATVTIPSSRLRELSATASVSARDLSAAGASADTARVEAKLARGQVTATATLTRGQGKIVSDIATSLPQAQVITVRSTIDEWPSGKVDQRPTFPADAPPAGDAFVYGGVEAYVSGKVELKVQPRAKAVNAEARLTGHIERERKFIGEFSVDAHSTNQQITLSLAKLSMLDGEAYASGIVDLTDINAARFDAKFVRLSLKDLAWLAEPLKDIQGRFNGELHVHPSTHPRALGPLAMQVNVTPEAARYRTVAVGDIRMTAFGGYQPNGDFRLVTDEAAINLAGGQVLPFLRLSYTQAHGLTQLVNVEFKNLNLEPLVHAFVEKREPMPGLINGSARLYGSLRSIAAINGEARVRLSKSDLVNFKPVNALYNIMRVGTAGSEPAGTGFVALRVEQARLHVNAAKYFNRGVEINAWGPVGQIDQIPDAPIKLMLVGSAQPLRDIKLPFFGDANKIMEVLQGAVSAVEATNTLRDPKVRQVFLSEFGDTFRGVLLGIVKEEQAE